MENVTNNTLVFEEVNMFKQNPAVNMIVYLSTDANGLPHVSLTYMLEDGEYFKGTDTLPSLTDGPVSVNVYLNPRNDNKVVAPSWYPRDRYFTDIFAIELSGEYDKLAVYTTIEMRILARLAADIDVTSREGRNALREILTTLDGLQDTLWDLYKAKPGAVSLI